MAKAYKVGAPDEPSFPADYEIVKRAILQYTDLKKNNNKYYAVELHKGTGSGDEGFRVYTHYGRTDDLETNPNAGARECRYFPSLAKATAAYDQIYRQKTSPAKGYKELSLASAKIGSEKGRGGASGQVDAKTLEKIEKKEGAKPVIKKSELPTPVQDLVRYLYEEATNALTTTVAAKITANGIETPLGVLTIGQIEKGEAILGELYSIYQQGKKSADKLAQLSGEFYTVIPHRIGRTRAAVAASVIDTLEEFTQKQETLQLMKDMLEVNGGEDGSVLFDDEVDSKYKALGCELGVLDVGGGEFQEIKSYVEKSQVKSKTIQVRNVWKLRRAGEQERFTRSLENQRLLFHGSRAQNWVGILSRGILMPKIVVSMGGNRTDAGWLGSGIYFGDAACTTLYYAHPGKRKTRWLTVARVALGKSKTYRQITYGIDKAPDGYDSCHGVRHTPALSSQFEDDEFVIYRPEQHQLEYLVEYAA
jgi:poly [ADP-ribose] polymerase